MQLPLRSLTLTAMRARDEALESVARLAQVNGGLSDASAGSGGVRVMMVMMVVVSLACCWCEGEDGGVMRVMIVEWLSPCSVIASLHGKY